MVASTILLSTHKRSRSDKQDPFVQTGISWRTALQLDTHFATGPLSPSTQTDLNLRNILVRSALRKRLGPTTPGPFPGTAAKCEASPYLCADSSVQGPSGHMQIMVKLYVPKRQPDVFGYLSDLRDDACGRETARALVTRFTEHLADSRHNRNKPVAQLFNTSKPHHHGPES